ncbi:MAG: nitroreductase [Oscillospiraceae bacterium]|jgi:nitroreductase|nr:nitroreductase [Oscillospiraceae bacterium]
MTNPVLDAIYERRSIRQYTADPVTDEQLALILKAAQESPSARNGQPWHFSVVTNQELIKEINDAACAELGKQGGFYANVRDIFYQAPVVIFISAETGANNWVTLDCGIASQSIALAAHSIGLGTVILGLPAAAFATEKAAEFNKKLGFPEGSEFSVAIALGKPAASKEPHPINDGHVSFVK